MWRASVRVKRRRGALPAPRLATNGSGSSSLDRRRLCDRQEDCHDGAAARRTLYLDAARVTANHTVHDGEPETAAFAHLLRGEERFEDTLDRLRIHAGTGIGHGETDEFSGAAAIGLTLGRQLDSDRPVFATDRLRGVGH